MFYPNITGMFLWVCLPSPHSEWTNESRSTSSVGVTWKPCCPLHTVTTGLRSQRCFWEKFQMDSTSSPNTKLTDTKRCDHLTKQPTFGYLSVFHKSSQRFEVLILLFLSFFIVGNRKVPWHYTRVVQFCNGSDHTFDWQQTVTTGLTETTTTW